MGKNTVEKNTVGKNTVGKNTTGYGLMEGAILGNRLSPLYGQYILTSKKKIANITLSV